MSFILNFRLKHPTRNTVSIDYNVAILMIPSLLYGTLFGITFNIMAPSILILSLMTIILSLSTYKTFIK
jgi:hypothetical protein